MNTDPEVSSAGKEAIKGEAEVSSRHENDMRAIIFAHQFTQIDDEHESTSAIKGSFLYYHRKTKGLRKILLLVILAMFLTSKPSWCIERGTEINDDCSIDVNGNYYNTSHGVYFDSKITFIVSFVAMYLIILLQVLKVQASTKVSQMESTKLILQVTVFFFSLLLSALETFDFIPNSDFNNALKVFFIMVYFKSILRAFTKLATIISQSASIFILEISSLLIFSVLAMVIFENLEIGQEDDLYAWSFSSFTRSFDSLFILSLGENNPEVLLEAYHNSVFYTIFFVIFTFLVTILIGSLVAGILFFFMKRLYIKTLNQTAAKYPNFDQILDPLLAKPYTKSKDIEEVEAQLHIPEGTDLEEFVRQRTRASAKEKLKRLATKITEVNRTTGAKSFLSQKDSYKQLKKSVFYKIFISLCAIYTACIPAFLVSKSNQEVIDYYQTSEVFAIIFLINFYFKHKFSLKESFWGVYNVLDLTTSFGIIVFSNILFLYPVDYREEVIISQMSFFYIWSFCCIFKLMMFNDVLCGLVNYKIIIKTAIHILPLLQDMISILLILLLFYSTIGMSIFGGMINSSFPQKYEELTGNSIPNQYQNMNYNDIFNSMATMSLYYLDFVMPTLSYSMVVFRSSNSNPTSFLFVKLFFYSFIIISNLIIFKLLVGFIIDFLGSNIDLNEATYRKQVSVFEKYDIIDLLWRKDIIDENKKTLLPSDIEASRERDISVDRSAVEESSVAEE